jgi:O-antigen/teichoic acid export membrane protein
MKNYAIIQPIYSIILLLAFLFFISINFISFKSAVFSLVLASGITGGIALALIRKYIRFKFDTSWGYHLTRYGSYALIAGVSSMFYSNIDKILINKFMTVTDIGIYQAYSYSITMGLLFLLNIFGSIFFPYASRSQKKDIILKRINRIIPFIIIIGVPFTIGLGLVILSLYGGKYPFDFRLALLFGIVTICFIFDKIYGTLLDSVGIKGKRIVSIASIILAIANISLNFLLIPLIGLEGAVIATIISYSLSIGIMFSRIRYIYHPEVVLG